MTDPLLHDGWRALVVLIGSGALVALAVFVIDMNRQIRERER